MGAQITWNACRPFQIQETAPVLSTIISYPDRPSSYPFPSNSSHLQLQNFLLNDSQAPQLPGIRTICGHFTNFIHELESRTQQKPRISDVGFSFARLIPAVSAPTSGAGAQNLAAMATSVTPKNVTRFLECENAGFSLLKDAASYPILRPCLKIEAIADLRARFHPFIPSDRNHHICNYSQSSDRCSFLDRGCFGAGLGSCVTD